jgi:hypothetical protein
MKLYLTWSLEPSNVNDFKAVILVQYERVDQDHFMAYTDAVQGLDDMDGVERADAMGNRMVHHLTFTNRLDRDMLGRLESAIETVYQFKCEAVEVEPMKISWGYSDPLNARLTLTSSVKPPTRKELVTRTAQTELPKAILEQLREAAAVTKKRVQADEISKADAWEFLHFLITQEVITS